MADDKQKARKAILGELESIKSLLENNLHDDLDNDEIEPPLLLQEVVHEEDEDGEDDVLDEMLFDDDSGLDDHDPRGEEGEDSAPLLTEAFNSVIDHIAHGDAQPLSPAEEKSADTDDIESLYADIYRSLKQHPETDGAASVDDLVQSVPVLEPVTDEDLKDLELLPEPDERPEVETPPAKTARNAAKSLFDDDDSGREANAGALDPATQPEKSRVAQSAAPANAAAQTTRAAPRRAAATRESTAASSPPRADVSPSQSSTQHSLFEETSAAPSSAAVTQQAIELSKKTENPFLPKHIRDRLQGNRITPPTLPAATPAQSTSASAIGKNPADQLVDDLVKTYLPKIENELRERLRNIVQQQLSPQELSPQKESDKKT